MIDFVYSNPFVVINLVLLWSAIVMATLQSTVRTPVRLSTNAYFAICCGCIFGTAAFLTQDTGEVIMVLTLGFGAWAAGYTIAGLENP